jgi:hypothetical protein
VLGRGSGGRGSSYANRDILERTILKKLSGFPSFADLKIVCQRSG